MSPVVGSRARAGRGLAGTHRPALLRTRRASRQWEWQWERQARSDPTSHAPRGSMAGRPGEGSTWQVASRQPALTTVCAATSYAVLTRAGRLATPPLED